MCGRIALYDEPRKIAEWLDAGLDPDLADGWTPSWNVAPTDPILGVGVGRAGERMLSTYRWGLVPRGAKDTGSIKNTFNARGETAAMKPVFRSAFRRGRILVPVGAFYEWEREGKEKQPFAFTRADGGPLVLAGLREKGRADDGTELRSATIITTQAGPDMPIHDRQPVVLEPEAWEHWLDPAVTDRDELKSLLGAGVEGTLVRRPVNRAVGNVRNDGPEMLVPEGV
ncbi:MAG TPA: SOS response-associated peptidase [Acidimicrobiales bacterium]|nr:SOS response-associated peptidase [Acidimicrobiales bacterium]